MSPLEQLRASQHNDRTEPSDAAWDAFMASIDTDVARCDLAPHTALEIRMLGRNHAA